jgi:hypothetical protein
MPLTRKQYLIRYADQTSAHLSRAIIKAQQTIGMYEGHHPELIDRWDNIIYEISVLQSEIDDIISEHKR